jgi:radical SAM protein with 4Fe4S-binding SPASM domain
VSSDHPSPYVRKASPLDNPLWTDQGPLLGSLDIELTERCNNDCIHCAINLPQGDEETRRRELSTSQIKSILTEAASLGALSVRFTGGEPLLREDFAELYIFARRLGLKVLIFTNARLINPDLAYLWAHIPPLEKIEVSVYGMTRSSYEAVSRIRGSFDEFRKGVGLLLQQRIPFIVKSALLPPNEQEVETFETWAASIPWMNIPPAYALFFELRGRRDSLTKNRLIQQLRLTPDKGLAFLTRHGETYRKEMREFCGKFIDPPGDRLFACGAGQAPCVDAYGSLQPCMPLRHPDMVYDLGKGSLREALTDFFPQKRDARATNLEYLAHCARCILKGLCEQCPARSWAEHGTLDTPVEYLCQVAHAQAYHLGLLQEGEYGWEVANWKERLAWI